MSDRKKTIMTNIMTVFVTLMMVVLISITGSAEEKIFNSQGKIIFNNRTEDTSDDVIFDAGDFNKLVYICR